MISWGFAMTPPRCRPFTILDAMVLVAATAVGMATIVHEYMTYWKGEQWYFPLFSFPDDIKTFEQKTVFELFWTIDFVRRFQPILAAWAYGVFLVRLRRPRPSRERLVRQPGFAASLAVVVCSLLCVTFILRNLVYFLLVAGRLDEDSDSPFGSLSNIAGALFFYAFDFCREFEVGLIVAVIWLLMAWGRIGRREPGWIDLLGRTLGYLWLAMLGLHIIQPQNP